RDEAFAAAHPVLVLHLQQVREAPREQHAFVVQLRARRAPVAAREHAGAATRLQGALHQVRDERRLAGASRAQVAHREDGHAQAVAGMVVEPPVAQGGRCAVRESERRQHCPRRRSQPPCPVHAGPAARSASISAACVAACVVTPATPAWLAICTTIFTSGAFGPNSTNRRTPSASIPSIVACQRTVPANWRRSASRACSAVVTGRASTLHHTGNAGSRIGTRASTSAKPSAAARRSEQWNGTDTGSSSVVLGGASETSSRNAAVSPATTICPGALTFATSHTPARTLPTSASTSGRGSLRTTTIPPVPTGT